MATAFVLIPYQQGSLFRPTHLEGPHRIGCLNPLSAGKSFQTTLAAGTLATSTVLIPYQQGSLFRHIRFLY